jgi:UDP-glucuronate 4-epimerase
MPGPRKFLGTGAAGFIGFHVANALLRRGDTVIGLDNVNSYFDPKLKRDILALLNTTPGLIFVEADIADQGTFDELPDDVTGVIHLAAQAGGRRSYEHPEEFIPSNLVGFYNAAAFAVARKVSHFVFASTSSVYGTGPERPSTEAMAANHPLSLYAATKSPMKRWRRRSPTLMVCQ